MALNLTPEERARGQNNFETAATQLTLTRRDMMKSLALSGAAVTAVSAAAYFQYSREKLKGKPVQAAIIGTGDEGGVLMGEHNPEYLQIVAIADIRPTNQKRIFTGDKDWQTRKSPRRGLNYHYGTDANKKIKVYSDYKKVLEDKNIEAVVIALPLFLHAPVAIEAMRAGKHVLCEKLMAWNISQCKEMIKVAEENDRILSIGHQRHYSMLYAHALDLMKSGLLGDVRHIRALWHRNNALPKTDSKGKEIPNEYRDSWHPEIPKEDADALAENIRKHGYKSMEELVRWRLFNRTGAGLMAELGSHQLDACSIFLGKVHPLAVSGVGGKFFYKDDREIDDHVFVNFEFPGPSYFTDPRERKAVKDKNDIVVVSYSSINTNNFEPYGECVMGSRGTMVVQEEQSIMLFPVGGRSMDVKVSTEGGKPVMESAASGPGAVTPARSGTILPAGPVSRGYREEMEHFAYCIRMWDQGMSKSDRPQVRCPGRQAMADAIIALTSNIAMREHKRIEFKEEWFDPKSPEVPDPDSKPETITG